MAAESGWDALTDICEQLKGKRKKIENRKKFACNHYARRVLSGMSKNSFFAESITLENGVSILTDVDCGLLIISFPDFDFEYLTADSQFAECDIEVLNYEKLVEVLSDENVTEDEFAKLITDSLKS